jgi:hypothetical protein
MLWVATTPRFQQNHMPNYAARYSVNSARRSTLPTIFLKIVLNRPSNSYSKRMVYCQTISPPWYRAAMSKYTGHSSKPTSILTTLTCSESKRKRLTLAPRQFDLSANTVLQAARLLRNSKYPSGQILEFLWLLTTSATLAANVDSFVSLTESGDIY